MRLKTFGFVGLGLIGGSLAMALKTLDNSCRIMACTRSSQTSGSLTVEELKNRCKP